MQLSELRARVIARTPTSVVTHGLHDHSSEDHMQLCTTGM